MSAVALPAQRSWPVGCRARMTTVRAEAAGGVRSISTVARVMVGGDSSARAARRGSTQGGQGGMLDRICRSMSSRETEAEPPRYLAPYARAAQAHGGSFDALLWASPDTQRMRFEALTRAVDFTGRTLLDVGCGRGDLLDYLRREGCAPAHYIGIEAVPALAAAARRACRADDQIIEGDFVREPLRMFTGAEIVVFCGSLNTLTDGEVRETLRRAWDAAVTAVAFNFLSSPRLAGENYLHWRTRDTVTAWCRAWGASFCVIDDYLQGDCTFALLKPAES